MDLPVALDLGREALLTALILAAPVLATGIIVGILVSLVQVITQLQDQTLSIAPKIIAMFGAAIFFVPWLCGRMVDFMRAMFAGW
jgi:flagellar biosynthetic protein FliQ